MLESLILVEGRNVDPEALRSLSLRNALQVVVGYVPDLGVVMHVAGAPPDDFGAALVAFAKVPNVAQVVTLMVRTAR